MAREVSDIKEFLELTRRADIQTATIKINKKVNAKGKSFRQTKFKVRGSRHLYTLIVNDAAKAKKLIQALPPTLEVQKL
ncbi:60S ribosomal protein L38 [Hanseniaspora vineae]